MDHIENNMPKLDLSELASAVLRCGRRFWALALVLILLFAGALGFRSYVTYRPVYQASVSFTVRVGNSLYSDVRAYNAKTAEQMAATFPYVLTSPALQQKVTEYLGVSTIPAVSASVHGNSNIFTLSVRDTDPQRAWDVLNAVIACYPDVADFVVGPTNLVMMDQTGVPTQPVNSYSLVNSMIKGGVIGFALWLAFVVVIAMTRTTIHTEDQLKKFLNLPCLGLVPATKVVNKNQNCPLVHKDRGNFGFSESIRILQMRTEKELSERHMQVLMVTSAIPGEGKTTIASNLAISFARKGKRVLLMDCDTFNPSVGKVISLPVDRIVAQMPLGQNGVNTSLYSTSFKNLFVVAPKANDQNDHFRMSLKVLTQMIGKLRNTFDYIIVDTPPCSLLADTSELAEAADCGLMVIRQDHASGDQILDGTRLLSDSGLPLIGCVLNSVQGRLTPGGYDYGYGHGYGYGYGYGYGSSESNKK